jgi:hypothetical protein
MMPATNAQENEMDDQTPFKMPPFTGRNILIFSDGTGQATDRYQESRRSVLPDIKTRRRRPAHAHWRRAGSIAPTGYALTTAAGSSGSGKGEYDRAIADYTAAIELNRSYLFA